jgi:hypothetical protein
VDVPFAVPEGYGGWVFLSDDTAPTEFHEPFTGTNSWILLEENLVLPTAGKYYVVAFDPAGSPGKLWVAVGESEAFGLSDIISLPATIKEVRKFHEISTGGFGFWIRRLFEWIKAIISFM